MKEKIKKLFKEQWITFLLIAFLAIGLIGGITIEPDKPDKPAGAITLWYLDGTILKPVDSMWTASVAVTGSISTNFEVTGSYASISGDLIFFGEIKPDGSTCGTNEILKRTGANNWDCAADAAGSVSSNSLDFDEFVDSMKLDANLTVASGSGPYTTTWHGDFFLQDNASVSGNFEIINTASASAFNGSAFGGIDCNDAGDQLLWSGGVFTCEALADGDIPDTITVSNYLPLAGGTLTGGLLGTTASFSGVFEFTNYASASVYRGGGLVDCDTATTSKLLWDTTNGVFSCGTDDDIPDATDYTNLTGGTGIAHAVTGTLTFDSSEVEAAIWGAGGNASNLWTFNLSAGDPTIRWTQSGASLSLNFEALGYASVSNYFGAGVNGAGDCNDATDKLLYDSGTGLFTCGTLANADIPADLSGTTKTFGVLLGAIDTGGATSFEIPNGAGFTFGQIGQVYFDTTDFQFQIASAAANSPRVVRTMVKLWSASIASTSSQFTSGGRYYLPIDRDKYNISEIHCDVSGGTSVVINVSSRAGNYDTETLTCDVDGANDTSIDTNSNYAGFTIASSSLELGTVTGTVNWLNFSIWGVILPE